MKLYIGEKLKNLRRERGLTQEEVAAHLGISFQAISKWERGDGYPDITFLPALSNYFGITVDELIGMDEIAADEKLEDFMLRWEQNRKNGLHRENAELMRSALKQFPNNALLLVQLSASLESLDGTEEEKKDCLRESIAVQEQILRYCGDSDVRGAVMYNICFAYRKNGQLDKAIEQAKKLPNLYKSRENALVYLLSDKDKRDIAKGALTPLAYGVYVHLSALAETENDGRYYEKILQIFDLLFGGEEDDFIKSLRSETAPKAAIAKA